MSVLKSLAKKSRQAAQVLALASTATKDQALRAMAQALSADKRKILAANQKDLKSAARKGVQGALLDRLRLDAGRIAAMGQGLEEVASLADPVGEVMSRSTRPNGLLIEKIRIPLGVIGMIYEARPNVTSDAAGLCIKSGNAVILRGGSEAFHSNRAVAAALQRGLREAGLPAACVQVLPSTDRHSIRQMLQLDDWIDLIIPRGGEALIRYVAKHSRIPVLKHYKGVCHLYVDQSAEAKMALAITLNGKVQRPGVCNAVETLLVHRSLADTLLPEILRALAAQNVELRVTPEIKKRFPQAKAAKPSDWGKEFLDLILAVKLVDSVDEAIAHIQRYGSAHTEAIVTQDAANAERFLKNLHSSMVLVNASTRFNDGGEIGLGAEVGISTTKLHAFGPMGLQDLTIGHFVVHGSGQIRGS